MNKIAGHWLVLGAVLSLGAGPAYAGVWTTFTVGDGLPGNNITAIEMSDSGTVFVAASTFADERYNSEIVEYNGIRFDSLSLRYADPPDFRGEFMYCPRQRNAFIVDIALHPNGDVWVGTNQNGVFRLGTTDYDHFTSCNGLGSNWIGSLLVRPNGEVWVGTLEDPGLASDPSLGAGGLSRFDGSSWSTITNAGGINLTSVTDMIVDGQGQIWMTLGEAFGGLVRHNGSTFTDFHRPGGSFDDQLKRLAIADDGRIWVTSFFRGGAVFESDGTWVNDFTTSDGLASNSLTDVVAGANGDMWVGTNVPGLQRWNGASWELFSTTNSDLPPNPGNPTASSIVALGIGSSGVLWIGTPAGLTRYEGAQWLALDQPHGFSFPPDRMRALSRGPKEDLPPGSLTGVTRGPVYATVKDSLGLLDIDAALVRVSGLSVEEVRRGDGSALRADFVGGRNLRRRKNASAFSGGAWVASPDTLYRTQDLVVVEGFTLPAGVDPSQEWGSVFVASDGTAWAGTKRAEPTDDEESQLLRYSGSSWDIFPVPESPPADTIGFTPSADEILVLDEDAQGHLWAASLVDGGAGRINPQDGSHWKYAKICITENCTPGLPNDSVNDIHVASNGDVWFATEDGVARLRGGAIEQVTNQGLETTLVWEIGEDQSGRIWIATNFGTSFFDGSIWASYGVADGLPGGNTNAIIPDTSQAVLATEAGKMTLFHPDRTSPPHAEVVLGPPDIIGSRSASFGFRGGDIDTDKDYVDLAWSLDGAPRSPFTKDNVTQVFSLADGPHVFEVWARDRALNISRPAQLVFEVDATAPQPIIASPTFGSAISGQTGVYGSVSDERFGGYLVEFAPAADERNWQIIDTGDTIPALGMPLATWNTEALPDGDYILRLAVTDTFNLTGYGVVGVIIDNEAPHADVTTPARINNATGGRIYTLNAEVEAYFPPQSLDEDRVVTIEKTPVLSTLPPGASRWLGGWEFSPDGFNTSKRVTLTFSLAKLDSIVQAGGGDPIPNPSPLAGPSSTTELGIFAINPDSSYSFLGGSVDPNLGTITTTIQRLSAFAVFEGFFAATTSGGRDIDIQPRAFSPRGNTFDTKAAISFNLNNGANVQIYVHDRSGRIVRRVFDGSLGPGRNVVDWDGRDGNGSVVPSGVYLVTIKTEGATDVKSVAVVNR